MATGTKFSVDKILAAAAKEKVQEELVSQLDDLNNPPITERPYLVNPEGMNAEEEETPLERLLGVLKSSKGQFINLYKLGEDGAKSFLTRIDQEVYSHWKDIESDLYEFIKAKTRATPKSYGNGRYRMEPRTDRGRMMSGVETFVYGGLENEVPVEPEKKKDGQEINVTEILKTLQHSTQDNIKTQTEALMKGLELGKGHSNDAGANNMAMMQFMSNMMTAMMTAMAQNRAPARSDAEMMDMMTTMMGNKNSKSEFEMFKEAMQLAMSMKGGNENSFKDNILMMKDLGMLPANNNGDARSKLEEVREVFNIATDLVGKGGGKASTLDRVLDLLIPKVPDMVSSITGAVNNYADAARAVRRPMPVNPARPPAIGNPAKTIATQEDDTMLFGFHPLFKELYAAIELHDSTKFPYITNRIIDLLGEQAVKDIVTGATPPDKLADMIKQYGGSRFKVSEFGSRLTAYITEYCAWCQTNFEVKTTHNVPPVPAPALAPNAPQPDKITKAPANGKAIIAQERRENVFVTRCNKCEDEVEWDSREQFLTDPNHVCGLEIGPDEFCDGELVEEETASMPGVSEEIVH